MIRVDYVAFAKFVFEQQACSTPDQLGSIFSAIATTSYQHGVELMEGEILEHGVAQDQAGRMTDEILEKSPQVIGGDPAAGDYLLKLFLSTQRGARQARFAPLTLAPLAALLFTL